MRAIVFVQSGNYFITSVHKGDDSVTEYAGYVRTNLTSFLSVRSIITVLHTVLNNHICSGESHDFPELLYVNSGMHTLKVDGVPYTMEPGQLILYAPHTFHEGHLSSSAVLNIISFEAELPESFPFYNKVITLTGKQQNTLSQIISEGLDVFHNAPEETGLLGTIPRVDIADYALQQLKNRLELFLIELYKTTEPKRPRTIAVNQENLHSEQFAMVTDFLSSQLSENLSLEQIAHGCSISVSKLKLLFKEQCSCGPIAYFIAMKITAAKKMICDTSLSFTQIAEQLGFQSVHYFSKLFKKKTGMTPSEYAKSLYKKT